MKLKFRYGGEIHEIGLGTVKPLGKSLAIRYGGQIYYASLILAKSDMSTAAKISLNGEIFSLAQEPMYFTPDSEYSCEVPDTDDTFKLSGLNTNLGMLLIDEGYIKTLDGRVVGTFENGIITLFDEALPYSAGVVGLTGGNYELVIAEKEVTPGAFTDISEGTIEYTTTKTLDRYESVGTNTYKFFAGSGGETFRLSGLDATVTAENAEEFIEVDDETRKAKIVKKPGESVTLVANDGSCKFIIDSGVSSMSFTGSNNGDTINVRGNYITLSGGTGNDSIMFAKSSSNNVLKFGEGSNSVNYHSELKIDFTGYVESENAISLLAALDESNVVFTKDENNLTVINGRQRNIATRYNNGTTNIAKSINLSIPSIKSMLTYNGTSQSAVTLNGTAEEANGKSIFSSNALLSGDYAGTAVTLTAAEGANGNKPMYIEGNAKNNVIESKNITLEGGAGNTIEGGKGNDTIYCSVGKDLIIFHPNNGSTNVCKYTPTQDTIQMCNIVEKNIVPSVSGGNLVFTVGSYALTFQSVLSAGAVVLDNVVDEFGDPINGITGYTFYTSGFYSKDGDVKIYSNVTTYTATGSEKTLDLSKATASVVTVNLSTARDGLVVKGFKPTFKLTIADITSANIYSCSYDDGTITLKLDDGREFTLYSTSNKLLLNSETIYIGDNAIYNAADGSATNVTLTPAYTGLFNASTNDKFQQSKIAIDASRTTGVTLIGGEYGNTLIGCSGDDILVGKDELADTFVYSGGIDRITNYNEALDIVSLKSVLDFSEAEFEDEDTSGDEEEGAEASDPFDSSIADLSDFNIDNEGTLTIGSADSGNLLIIDNADTTALTFEMQDVRKIFIFSPDGRLNNTKTDISLKSGHGDFDLSTSDNGNYADIASIYANAAESGAIIVSNAGLSSFINAGGNNLTLVGKSDNDTLRDGLGNCSLVGGGSSSVFIIGGGNDTIANYSAGNQISLETYTLFDISGASSVADGLQLTFTGESSEHTLNLQGISSSNAINFDGIDYTFDLENQKVFSPTGEMICLAPNLNVTLGTGDYVDVKHLILRNGGTITAGTTAATLGGYNVSLVGGKASDTFIYGGGDMTINGYGTSGTDKISLPSGYQIADFGNNCITIIGAYDDYIRGHIYIEGEPKTSVKVVASGTTKTLYSNNDIGVFNNTTDSLATAVTVKTQFGDFGAIGSATNTSSIKGTEYYGIMYTIEAARCNSFLTGGVKANRLIAKGGTKNILTGGLGCDTFLFNNGGGVVRDFGLGAPKFGDNHTLAKTTSQSETATYTEYNRKNPQSYFEGSDYLRVKGKVVEIAYKGYGDDTTKKFPHNKFTAYVTYISDYDKQAYTIALDNIVKKATTCSTTATKQKYQSNDVAVKTLNIYDTSSDGITIAKLDSAAIAKLLRSLNDADEGALRYTAYKSNIDALATFVSDETMRVDKTNYKNAIIKQFDRMVALYSAGGVTNDTTLPPA